MKCQTCGKENETTNTFCTDCGNSLMSDNPTKIYEIITRVGNFILFIPLYIALSIFLLALFETLILAVAASFMFTFGGLVTNVDIENIFIGGMETALLVFWITAVVFIIFNIIMGILMYKKNKHKIYIGKYKSVKKVTYVLLAFFLGIYGVHRFVIGDKKGGVIRLIITLGVPFIAAFFSTIFDNSVIISFYLVIICMMISQSLALSDFVIGLSKVSNENKRISI